ncbi:nuclease-related domain-containing protein [Neobacillus sp. SCS-31]|uniref:nuclease-related domain-containing protein n=1 Tax=Neobacillus oceani TaxID=3115292 RepID=UPI003905E41B
MEVLPKVVSVSILAMEALKGRVLPSLKIYNELVEDLKKEWAGHNGEKSLIYPLRHLENNKYLIFHGLRLQGDGYTVQLDVYLISRYFSLILEAKNWAGEVCFKKNPKQVVRIVNDVTQGMPNPVEQVKMQQHNIKKWLADNHLPSIPIEGYAVFGSSTIVTIEKGYYEAEKFICKTDYLYSTIRKMETLYKTPILTHEELHEIKTKLLEKNTPLIKNLYEHYRFERSVVITGVRCPQCLALGMKYKRKQWYCACGCNSKDAHIQALRDYLLLFGPMISNQELRWFLHLPSKSITSKLMAEVKLEKVGSTRNARYKLPWYLVYSTSKK